MNKQIPLMILLAVGFLAATGCLSQGMHRTSLEKWKIKNFDNIGITLEMPKKSLLVKVYDPGVENWKNGLSDSCSLSFEWHMYYSGHLLADAYHSAQFMLMRMTASQYESFRNGTHFWSGYWIWKDYHSQEYTQATHFEWTDNNYGDMYGWRRDYHAPNGDVVVAGVAYHPMGEWDNETRAADSNAIKRVLNSVVID